MARQPEVEISVREATGDGCSADPCLGTSPAKAHIWLYPHLAQAASIATPSLNKYNAIYSLTGHLISRSAFLEHAASIGAPFDKLVVGVAIAQPLVSATTPLQILILQRAAREKVYPGFYVLPGGSATVSPLHIYMCIDRLLKAMLRILIKRSRTVREVAEETGLIVSHIVGEIPRGRGRHPNSSRKVEGNFVAQVLVASALWLQRGRTQ